MRLIANELHQLGWKALVLTVDERDYEEPLVQEMNMLVEPEVEVVRVRARKVVTAFGKRIIGDIGLRAWFPLRRAALRILEEREISFILFSMPSWYPSLIGCGLNRKTGTPFGIDYRDPWVYQLSDKEKGFNRGTLTTRIARILEPLALRNVSLVTGVSDGYLSGVRNRYKKLSAVPSMTFQMGFREKDHRIEIPEFKCPFEAKKRTFVYAGAYWPLGAPLFNEFLRAVAVAKTTGLGKDVQFLFIGTDNANLPPLIKEAERLNLGDTFRELPDRMSFLEIQQILREAEGAIILGSTEEHYSASKIFQCLVTAKRTSAYFHEKSEGAAILKECNASTFYHAFKPEKSEEDRVQSLAKCIIKFTDERSVWAPNLSPLEQYSSLSNAKKLVEAIQQIILK
jgi:hypothetical protein